MPDDNKGILEMAHETHQANAERIGLDKIIKKKEEKGSNNNGKSNIEYVKEVIGYSKAKMTRLVKAGKNKINEFASKLSQRRAEAIRKAELEKQAQEQRKKEDYAKVMKLVDTGKSKVKEFVQEASTSVTKLKEDVKNQMKKDASAAKKQTNSKKQANNQKQSVVNKQKVPVRPTITNNKDINLIMNRGKTR